MAARGCVCAGEFVIPVWSADPCLLPLLLSFLYFTICREYLYTRPDTNEYIWNCIADDAFINTARFWARCEPGTSRGSRALLAKDICPRLCLFAAADNGLLSGITISVKPKAARLMCGDRLYY